MAPIAFPIVKLGALAVRQISKPLANRIKQKSKESLFFRTYICMPPAQFYHKCEVLIKRYILNIGKTHKPVPKLNEAAAIELGAEILGEFVVFSIAAGVLTAEYARQANKVAQEAEEQEKKWKAVEERLKELELTNDRQSAEIRSLTRFSHAAAPKLKIKYEPPITDSQDKKEDKK